MKNILYLLIIILFITNCTLNKAQNYQGVHFLDNKQKKLTREIKKAQILGLI